MVPIFLICQIVDWSICSRRRDAISPASLEHTVRRLGLDGVYSAFGSSSQPGPYSAAYDWYLVHRNFGMIWNQ